MRPGSKTLRIVIDTNVLFSAIALPRDSPPTRILDLARTGKIDAFISLFILGELENNLSRKARWDDERIQALRKKLKGFLAIIEITSQVDAIKGMDGDNRILACAVDAKADILVTGDLRDIRPLGVFRGVKILTPRELLDQYFPDFR